MIIKKRSIDYKYIGLEMLYQRLPDEHPMKKVINSKILSAKAGIIGEKIVEEVFNKYNFPFNYCVLHDLNLSSNGKFQIDTLFICPYYAVVLECKNIVGELSFEKDPPYLKRELENGQKDGFESPEVQLDRNIYLLSEWLSVRGIDIPVMGVVVFSSTKSRIVKPPDHTATIYARSIPVYLRGLPREKEYLTLTQMSDLAHSIAKAHQAYFPYPMCKNWRIDPEDLITGVLCGKCGRFGMERLKRTWLCPGCSNRDATAHINSVNEWFVLIGEQISNSECRRFLHINQHQTVTRILQGMGLIIEGEGKATKYKISKKMLSGHKIFYMDKKNFIRS
ncbi:nuclease-related domain-containing protein [Psychrobacillus sp. FSL H8-0484]|uniref:nuclease-related domain-containing protein n=1 Tax=Psychrobacillus sp. FSL H8-0484 TaxID=2921390 RepID=UPI0030FA0AF9